MSAKKESDSTTLPVEYSSDSGFLSGPIDSLPSVLTDEPTDCDSSPDIKVTSASTEEEDQGVCLISGSLDRQHIEDCTPVIQPAARPEERSAPTLASALESQRLRDLLFSQDVDGDTPLHIAAVHGCKQTIGMLINLCSDKKWLDISNEYGHTALHLAIMSRNAVVAKMLVKAGASLAIRDHTGETPLHTAVSTGQKECIVALVDPVLGHQRLRSAIFDQKNYNGQACVHLAASAGRVDLLQTLVHYGANVNIKEGRAGWTPLHIAARRGDERLVQFLLRCPGLDSAPRDYAGRTPRRLARRSRLAAAFHRLDDDSETDTDSEEDDYDSESEQLFEKLEAMKSPQSINVV